MAQAATEAPRRRSTRNTKSEDKRTDTSTVKEEPKSSPRRIKREFSPSTPTKSPAKRLKTSSTESPTKSSPKTPADKAAQLQARKLKSYGNKSPFPDFAHPTPDECRLAHRILASLHGDRHRPTEIKAPTASAGCGDSPSVLDALVRTILSQNTSDKNSSRAKKSMDQEYGGSDQWEEIVKGGQPRLQKTIQSGGLSVVKSKVIISILEQAKEKYGKYSLDHLFQASNEDAMTEMLSFQGVGPKTASCVLLFCLQRESFAVDTHVHRITGLLGWRPPNCNREESHQHLDDRIPDEEKYALHILIIRHGKDCDECKAGGKNLGKCELRKAFRKGKVKGEAGEDVKKEEIEEIKKEEED
ncbi:base excision DNA repair protein [Sarocladium strictum]